MPSRQDQLHSYQFMIQRVVAALVMRETDPAQSPFRRAMGATVASVLIAAIVLAGTAAWAFLRGSSAKNWKNGARSAVVLEKETGASYVLRNGVLHPVLNFTSGVLITGSAKPVTVSARALEGEPRGATLGVVDLPASLPARNRLTAGPWTVCSATGTDTTSTLTVGAGPVGGAELRDRAALVEGAGGANWLLWQGRRYRITAEALLKQLGGGTIQPVRVAEALLKPIEEGDRIAPVRPAGYGEVSTRTGLRIGTVVTAGPTLWGVVVAEGVAPVTTLQRTLALSDPGYRAAAGADREIAIELGQWNDWAESPWTPSRPTAAPATLPDLARVDGAACATYDPAQDDPARRLTLHTGSALPDVQRRTRTPGTGPAGTVLADYVLVRPGWGALVQAAPAPGATGGTVLLVTDPGRQFALADPADVKKRLGYATVTPVAVPSGFTGLIPAGAGLDPAAADKAVTAP
ncbi:type VII secretion protein EccB [Spirilliplanes yamanashiensis]|uniref:Type VII secretion protein EccB n=1 Tax=Spirilliplanes yamanashiensis TaxID=42233 RepID=A0A8J3Y802_9ACTN|nr:type VII secretion protein EccB [Spirilliplanes yamanashiensis]MDP9815396.1 type VII secretion protein EccB [Spirilliplanes yamanashiensis]GIJ03651.1 type VII secretion protein EccB [Spirilliplanes yamanashiensis]